MAVWPSCRRWARRSWGARRGLARAGGLAVKGFVLFLVGVLISQHRQRVRPLMLSGKSRMGTPC